ncbi:MAG: recombinase family protein, partial [Oscillospiraceae bacterium]|nr:recombinase family protein [Oscillospiraceae bacterium]
DSLPVQRDELSNYCKYALNLESFEIFEDAGYSAKNTERPAYQQMMARLRTGEFSHLVVWKIDRISRNLIDFASMYEEIKRLGVTFVSKNEQFDTSSAMGEAMLKIILVFAELERKVTSERVTAIMLSRAANGQWNGGRIPYGYEYEKQTNTFSIADNESAVVRMIFDMYEREKSLTVVAKAMNEKGLKSRRGAAWSPVSLNGILRSPFYIGTYRYNYRDEAQTGNAGHDFKDEADWVMVENHHDPIIDREQWDRVSDILTGNRRIVGGGVTYNRGNVHIFAGLLKCGSCGSGLNAAPDRARRDGWRPSVYSCSRRKRFNDCDNKYVSDVVLGPFALNYIANMMKSQRSFGVSTSIEILEKKLLRGKILADVEHIEGAGLQELYDTLRRNKIPDVPYTINERSTEGAENKPQEIDLLVSEKRRSERALARLQSLFLYGESAIAEKDYLVEKKRITDELTNIDARIELLEKDRTSHFSLSDEEFIERASYFILTQQLTDKREVDYEKFVRKIDPRIVKDFLNSVVQNFCIKDGRIESVRFKNGMEHRFLYKGDE